MSNKDFFNDLETKIDFIIVIVIQQALLEARIVAAVQQALSNLDFQSQQQNATSAAKLFKLTDIEFFDSEQDVEDDKL